MRRGRPTRRQGRHPRLRQAVSGLSGRAERLRLQRPRLHLHVAAARLAPGRLGLVAPEADEEGAGDGDRDAALQPHLRRGRRRGLQRDRRAAGQQRRRDEGRLRRPPRLPLHRSPGQRHLLRRPARHRQGDADERLQAREHDGVLQHHRGGVGLHGLQLRLAGRLRVLDPAHAPGLGGQGQGHAQHGAARLQEGQHVVHRHARAQAVAEGRDEEASEAGRAQGRQGLHAEPEPLVQLQRPVGAHGDRHPLGVHVDARRLLLVALLPHQLRRAEHARLGLLQEEHQAQRRAGQERGPQPAAVQPVDPGGRPAGGLHRRRLQGRRHRRRPPRRAT